MIRWDKLKRRVALLVITMMLSSNLIGCEGRDQIFELPDEEITEEIKEIEENEGDNNQEVPSNNENEEVTDEETKDQNEEVEEIEDIYVRAKKAKYIKESKFTQVIQQSFNSSKEIKNHTKKYQLAASSCIENYRSKKQYTIKNPLLIENPYGTIEQSMFVHFTTDKVGSLRYTIHVEDDSISDFTRTMNVVTSEPENKTKSDNESKVKDETDLIQASEVEQVKEAKQVLETERVSEIEQASETEQSTEVELVSEIEQINETEQASENEFVVMEGTLLGFVPGMRNYVQLEIVDEDGNQLEEAYFYLDWAKNDTLPRQFKPKYLTTKEAQKNEMYLVYGYNSKESSTKGIILVDDYGCTRGVIRTKNNQWYGDIIVVDEAMYYPYSKTKFVKLNSIGSMEEIYSLKEYKLYQGFTYDKIENRIIFIGSDKLGETTGDKVIELNLITGTETLLFDFKTQCADLYEKYKESEYNQSKESWIDLNGIQMVTENDILVSSKDLSSIFRINDIYDNPNINCIISEEGLWKDTIYKDLLLHKIGEFETHLGQTDIKVMAEDKDLMPGQFFVGLENRHIHQSQILYDIDWNQLLQEMDSNHMIIPDVVIENMEESSETEIDEESVLEDEKPKSTYYKYIIDMNTRTFTLAEMISLPYVGEYGSSDLEQGNIVYSYLNEQDKYIFGRTSDQKTQQFELSEEDRLKHVDYHSMAGLFFEK